MFCDEATIKVISGNGGNGALSFHREKFVPNGPPDGGDGGWGGNVVFRANRNLNTLSTYRTHKRHKAESGENGAKRNCAGKDGEDLILDVPEGTQIYDEENQNILCDLQVHNDTYTCVIGGKGGLGNARFVNSVNQAPKIAERGEPGKEKIVRLELKLVADVGIIGMPNAGKSTLISVISNAKPKIANYPFTTIVPNLGVVPIAGEHLVMCDIPGLIEGAHEGKGLGDDFLKHTERTKILIHLLDANSPHIFEEYKNINLELAKFSENLSKKPQILAINKIDLVDEECIKLLEEEAKKAGIKQKIFFISGITKKGLEPLLKKALLEVSKVNKKVHENQEVNEEKIKVYRPHLKAKMENFELQKIHGKFHVIGTRIEQLVKMTDFQQDQAVNRVYNIMNKAGISKALAKEGLRPGDTFCICNYELPFRE